MANAKRSGRNRSSTQAVEAPGEEAAVGSQLNGIFWGAYAEQAGILRLSVHLLSGAAELGMTRDEVLWTIHALSYQFHPDEPTFVGHKLLAKQMGVHERTSRRHADSLSAKGLLTKLDRGRKWDGTYNSKELDFRPLIDKVDALAKEDMLRDQSKRASKPRKELKSPEVIERRARELNEIYLESFGNIPL